jgi:hypothetical protein
LASGSRSPPKQVLDFTHDVHDAKLFFKDVLRQLLGGHVLEIFLGVRVFQLEIGTIFQDSFG